jgi:hypothetical protein
MSRRLSFAREITFYDHTVRQIHQHYVKQVDNRLSDAEDVHFSHSPLHLVLVNLPCRRVVVAKMPLSGAPL